MKGKATVILAFICTVVTFSVLLESCKKGDVGPVNNTPIDFTPPQGFPSVQYNFSANPLTVEGVALGRKLFYDGRLSKDGKYPCSSCHQNFAAFATFEHDFSHGYNFTYTTRNAPGIFNAAFQKEFKWDGAIKHLDAQYLTHITAPNEMADNMQNVILKLRVDSEYRKMFKAAFGTEEINYDKMAKALSQFIVTIVSDNAKYDKIKRGEASFTTQEQAGYTLFQSKCASCHTEPLFTDNSYRNNGLTLDPQLKDFGRMNVTTAKTDSLKFKVPSLRNVELTRPYMHDGRLWTLQAVMDHYSSGITHSSTLDPFLIGGIALTSTEKTQLISFLRTLTDTTMVNNPKFSEP